MILKLPAKLLPLQSGIWESKKLAMHPSLLFSKLSNSPFPRSSADDVALSRLAVPEKNTQTIL